ncbi:hypothetical protein FHL15_000397 [Xylaria flabelliformis]|uniref:UBZ4-type domain-containing protein n=1 Tax=Xylaria flabelliformis TaxID=2512241 RepID=A0A553IFS5_9PEZI|nr:hypothetical protein FHL15_000397 [Xylaria flabelliformis]
MAPAPVPRTHQVIPGARVNIVQKDDQRTGRQVLGTVQHVLTRGDHHRGIKVRLTDGRVGRVQSMAQGAESGLSTQPSSESTSMSDQNPLPSIVPAAENARKSRGQGRQPRYRDARLDESLDAAPEQIDLGAYIVPSRRKGKAKKGRNANSDEADNSENVGPNNNNCYDVTADVPSAIATCPVCGAFEGDEAAVAHHVAGHFES